MAFSCCKVAAGLVVLAVIGAGLLAVRLQQGPIAVEGLGEKIASALHDRFGKGMQFALGQTSLMQRGFGPTLGIDKLAVTGPNGESVLTAPRAEIAIDPVALFFGRVVPKRLEVFDVTLRLVLSKDGKLAVAAGDGRKPFFESRPADTPPGQAPAPDQHAADPAPAQAGSPHRAVVMKQAAGAIRQFLDMLTDPQSSIAAVDRLGIARGTLVIEDQATGDVVAYKDFDLVFDKAHGVTNFASSAVGPSRRWTVSAVATGTPGSDRHFRLKAENISMDEVQLAAGLRSLGVDTDAPMGMHLDIGLKPDNTLSQAGGGFSLAAGFLRTDDPDQEPIFINSLDGDFCWNPAKREIELSPIRYVEGSTRFVAAGGIRPPANEGDPWQIALGLTEAGVLGPDRKGQTPVAIDHGRFAGRLLLDQKTFRIDHFDFGGKEGALAMTGQADWINGPHIRLGASINPTTVRVAQRVWPSFMAAPVRAWILSHFEAGTLTSGTIKIDYDADALKRMRADRAPMDGAVALDFTVSKGRVRYLEGVPPLEDVEGVGHITGRTSRFTIRSATMNADGKRIDLLDGGFSVPNSSHHPTAAVVSAHLAGSVEGVTNILSRDALKPYASLPLDPATLHGHLDGTLEKHLTLSPGNDPAKDPLNVEAKVTDFVADHLIGKEGLQDATLIIKVGDGMLKASGQGRIFGGPANFEIVRIGTAPPNAVITATLDDAARGKLGLDAIPGLTGPIIAHVNADLGDIAKITAQVDLDLAKTTVAAAYLGLSKPAGKPAKIAFTATPRDDRLVIDPIAIDVGPLQGRGSIGLGVDNAFQSAHFATLKVSPGDDMKLDVTKADDTFRLTIRGTTIDARPFLKALTSTPANDGTPLSRSAKAEKKEIDSFKGFDIDLKSGILTGFNKEVMSGVDLRLSKRGAQIRQFAVQGRFGGEAVSGSMDSRQRIKVSAQDGGALVSFIDLYKHMEGGNLSASMQMGEDTLNGNLEIRDFTLRDEPAIRRLVAQSATVSAPGQDADAARRINAGAVGFKRLKVNFNRAGTRLELRDATMYGSEIGLSVDGWLDYSQDRVAMNGTFVPVFAINNLFSQIPVFGMFLGGKSNEGLLAITFRISGLASSPTLSINPLSAIAPGFLRNIFGILDQPAGGEPPAFPSR